MRKLLFGLGSLQSFVGSGWFRAGRFWCLFGFGLTLGELWRALLASCAGVMCALRRLGSFLTGSDLALVFGFAVTLSVSFGSLGSARFGLGMAAG